MPLARGYLDPHAKPGDQTSKILVTMDSGANLPVLAAQVWRDHEATIRRCSPSLRIYRLSPGQHMGGFCGEGAPMRAILRGLCIRIGYCKVVTDVVVMDSSPYPLVLGTAFWWVYDCNLEGRKKTLSMLVPQGEFLQQHCPPSILADRPEFGKDPERVVTRQFLRASEDQFSFSTRNYKLRGEEVAELTL